MHNKLLYFKSFQTMKLEYNMSLFIINLLTNPFFSLISILNLFTHLKSVYLTWTVIADFWVGGV